MIYSAFTPEYFEVINQHDIARMLKTGYIDPATTQYFVATALQENPGLIPEKIEVKLFKSTFFVFNR